MSNVVPMLITIVFPFFQSLCNALKYALNNLLNDFKPMLPDLCGLVISIIHAKFVPPVEIAQKCIILFYKDAECQSIMKQCFMEVVSYNILVFEVRHTFDIFILQFVLFPIPLCAPVRYGTAVNGSIELHLSLIH